MDDPSQSIDVPAYVAQYQDSLNFPQKLMFMLFHSEDESARLVPGQKGIQRPPIAWALEGKAFIIFDKETLVSHWFPLFFNNCSKYQSFTRNLYRWGFKRVPLLADQPSTRASSNNNKNVECFKNKYFQRNNTPLLHCMENVTAEKMRARSSRQIECAHQLPGEDIPVRPILSDERPSAKRAQTTSSRQSPDDAATKIHKTDPNAPSDMLSISSDSRPTNVLGYAQMPFDHQSTAEFLCHTQKHLMETDANSLLTPDPDSAIGVPLPATHNPSLCSMTQYFEDCDLYDIDLSTVLGTLKSPASAPVPQQCSNEMVPAQILCALYDDTNADISTSPSKNVHQETE